MGLNKNREPLCPYRKTANGKGSIHCRSYKVAPSECETCGWNPKVEAERKELLRSGKVKTFLIRDVKELNRLFGSWNHRKED